MIVLTLASAGCAPEVGAKDSLPPGARRVAVPRRPELESHEADFCAWSCGLAKRPGERLATCRSLRIDPRISDALGTSRGAILCIFQ